jgi:hypothetical protein
LALVAAAQGGVFSRRQALECGSTPDQIREHLARGRWERVRHGQYAEVRDAAALTPWERRRAAHRRLVHAVVNSRRPGSVAVSHQSALVLHGLPDWGMSFEDVHLTRLDDRGGCRCAGVQEHVGRLSAQDLTRTDGRPATAVPRAVAETACTSSFEAAVVVADAATRTRRIAEEDWARVLAEVEFWPGSPTARAALSFMNPLSESVGESRLRVLMHTYGLPAPELQVEFHDRGGFVARVDFFVREYGVVVEFDGLTKYADGSASVLIQEKLREDRLRALGLRVIRATWSDLASPDGVVARIQQALTSRTAA